MIRNKRHIKYPKNVKEQELIQFLSGEMTKEQQLAFEEQIAQDQFLSDAAEGLGSMNKEQVPQMIADLNLNLKKQINVKRGRAKLFNPSKLLIWVSVIVVLLFVFIAWWYLTMII